ncbi:MAG: hypothetical protein QOI78_8313 [Actinomycetota bacterium]|nr:hypothetical protein [Actinomycetota bacterium]
MTSSTADPATSEAAIRTALDEVSAAWAAGDGDAFAARYAENATAIGPGFQLMDKDTIGTTMAGAFAGPLHGTQRRHRVHSLRFLGNDTAIVITHSRTVPAGTPDPLAGEPEWATWTLARHGNQWLIAAYHGWPQNPA